MSLFSSPRERRLWIWTLVVVGAIYSTLVLAKPLAGVLGDRNVIAGVFVLGMLLVGLAVVVLAWRTRPGNIEIGIGLGVIAAYFLVLFRITAPGERSHLIEYSVVAALIYQALQERASQGRRVPTPALLALLTTSLIGTLDETIQIFLPSRVFDPEDILFNILASLMAVTASAALNWAKQWRRS